MMARSGGLPALARTRTWVSNDLSPSYLIVMPVHFSNVLYDSMCGLSSGVTMPV